jgi:hypothetical protein
MSFVLCSSVLPLISPPILAIWYLSGICVKYHTNYHRPLATACSCILYTSPLGIRKVFQCLVQIKCPLF